MKTKKYKLTKETIIIADKTLYRIEALKDFGDVKKGDRDGFIENENNLSQYGDCWVYDNAMVYDDAEVYDNARVYGNAKVYGNPMQKSVTMQLPMAMRLSVGMREFMTM